MLLALVYTYRQGRVEFEYLSDWVKILSASGGEADGRPGMFAERFGTIELEQVGGTGDDLQLLGRYISDINTVRIHYRLNNEGLDFGISVHCCISSSSK